MPTAQQLRRRRAARKRRTVTGRGVKFRGSDDRRRDKFGRDIGPRVARGRKAEGFETISDASEGGVKSSGGEQTAKVEGLNKKARRTDAGRPRRKSKSKRTAERASERKTGMAGLEGAAAAALRGLSEPAAAAVKEVMGMTPDQTTALAGGPTGMEAGQIPQSNMLWPNPLYAMYLNQVLPAAYGMAGQAIQGAIPQAQAYGAQMPPQGMPQQMQLPQMPDLSAAQAYGAQQGAPQGPQMLGQLPPVGQATPGTGVNPNTGGAYMRPPGIQGVLEAILGYLGPNGLQNQGNAPIYGPEGPR